MLWQYEFIVRGKKRSDEGLPDFNQPDLGFERTVRAVAKTEREAHNIIKPLFTDRKEIQPPCTYTLTAQQEIAAADESHERYTNQGPFIAFAQPLEFTVNQSASYLPIGSSTIAISVPILIFGTLAYLQDKLLAPLILGTAIAAAGIWIVEKSRPALKIAALLHCVTVVVAFVAMALWGDRGSDEMAGFAALTWLWAITNSMFLIKSLISSRPPAKTKTQNHHAA
ncbi:hypothetical protein STSP2_00127 [Anaerohalosphaera lusitana]|uniref:Uncharacterized protein n=1 Tax=Anaerohalosphaera lusitana TaxID=1936003 RepID=A0A1U9NGD1_9BACT|nr:hypothetical protein [Anaerohalosphaera lusitana]AQT66989.1 hypothetical protein STSP2_00127 [Anaerohalosphaera lusitana]